MALIESWLEGPRWNDIEVWLMKTALELKLKCSTNIKKGFLRKTVFYKIEGEENCLLMFKKRIETLVSNS